jgi:hypothetical protein
MAVGSGSSTDDIANAIMAHAENCYKTDLEVAELNVLVEELKDNVSVDTKRVRE